MRKQEKEKEKRIKHVILHADSLCVSYQTAVNQRTRINIVSCSNHSLSC